MRRILPFDRFSFLGRLAAGIIALRRRLPPIQPRAFA